MRKPKRCHSKNQICPCGRPGVWWDKMPVCALCYEREKKFWGGNAQREKRVIPLSTYWYQENSEALIYKK